MDRLYYGALSVVALYRGSRLVYEAGEIAPPATVPARMAAPTVTAISATELRITRAAAPDDGGSPITGYLLAVSTDGGPWTLIEDAPEVYTITDAEPDTTYSARTAALNAIGRGEWSEIGSDTTHAVPVPVNRVPPVITGPGIAGQEHTATLGAWDGAETYQRRWLLDGVPVGTGSSYTPTGPGSLTHEVRAAGGEWSAWVTSEMVVIEATEPGTNTLTFNGQPLTFNGAPLTFNTEAA